MGPDKEKILHGTHVAGIVAQVRNNNIGGDGIANNVEILTVRAVPDGDSMIKI
jgi:subtilisin family serine protease